MQPCTKKTAELSAYFNAYGASPAVPLTRTSRTATPNDSITHYLMQVARIRPDQKVLDLASGPGEPALSIARQMDSDGLVVATDLVPGMLHGLKARVDKGRAHIAVTAAEMSRLPFVSACFDVVTSRLGIMFTHDLGGTLQEVRRVLRPDGLVVFAAWGDLEGNVVFRTVHAVIPCFMELLPQTGNGPT